MDKKRREFLKIAGISTLAGLSAPAVVDRMVSGSFPLAAKAAQEIARGEKANDQAATEAHGEKPFPQENGTAW